MKRASGPSVRLDIVGLEPRIFLMCRENNRTLVQSRGKERLVSTESSNLAPTNSELASIPKDQLALYNKIVSITVDFERAYGRGVEVRVFERSSNKLLNTFLRGRDSSLEVKPTFYVNGVKVYTGIPNSFSELDEAIDNSFGRRD
ncbi:MAG: hypothetical protein PXY39_06480 [archaeon]|nr:hypothetical protein [archaeon]